MNDELMHHGILGMKWGVRRTPEQLGHRTEKSSDSIKSLFKKKEDDSKKKKLSKMTDEEIRQRIQRMNLEEQYSDLVARQKKRGTGAVKKLLGEALENLGRKALGLAVDKIIEKVSKGNDPDSDLKKEIDHLRLVDQRDELIKKKNDRDNPKSEFDINKWKTADVDSMDYDTIQKVSKWYANAKAIESVRGTSSKSAPAKDTKRQESKTEQQSKNTVKLSPKAIERDRNKRDKDQYKWIG